MSCGYIPWTTFSPVGYIPWMESTMSSTGYDIPWTTPYPVDDMLCPVGAVSGRHIPWTTYHVPWTTYHIPWVSCVVGSCSGHGPSGNIQWAWAGHTQWRTMCIQWVAHTGYMSRGQHSSHAVGVMWVLCPVGTSRGQHVHIPWVTTLEDCRPRYM